MSRVEWVPYRPSNGTEGEGFLDRFCHECARDGYTDAHPERGCQILARSLAHQIGEPGYPREWVRRADDVIGRSARCTAFVHRRVRSERAKRAWATRREHARAAFAGELFLWD